MRYVIMVLMVLVVGCTRQNTPLEQPKTNTSSTAPGGLKALLAQPGVSCKSNDECHISRMYVGDDGTCCHSCNMSPMNKATFEQADALCRKNYGEQCPQKKCVSGQAVCERGQCVVHRQ